MSVKTVGMIAALPAGVKILSQNIPNEESSGDPPPRPASDSLSFLTRLITPGLSPLFPQLAASGVALMLSGAASSLEVGR